MRVRIVTLAVLAALMLAAPAAQAARSIGTPEQITWVRRAAERFIKAELTHNGAEACAVLNAPMRAVVHGTSCDHRWNARIRKMLRRPGVRSGLKRELKATWHARVVVHGRTATIYLPAPLIKGPSRFLWTENCWMLEG